MTDVNPILALTDLAISYQGRGRTTKAVEGVTLSVNRGEIVALVGESGSGKSTIAHAIMGMLPPTAGIRAGAIQFDGRTITGLSESEYRRLRGRRLGWIPQDPMVALNPSQRVGRQVAEPLLIHGLASKTEARARAVDALDRAGLSRPALRATQFPHELSGGMRQRALIAGALICGPDLLIADEPTTALDVTVQKRILDDIAALVAASGTAVLLITHDLGVAADRADRIIVLRQGRIVEEGPTSQVLANPRQAYTRLLIDSAPGLSPRAHLHKRRGGWRDDSVTSLHAGAVTIASVENVSKDYVVTDAKGRRETFRAVDAISLAVSQGETLGLVGESGSGKSTLLRMFLGLVKPTAGAALYEGRRLDQLSAAEERSRRQRVQPVYQNPYSSLNPRMTIAEIVGEHLAGFRLGDRRGQQRRVMELLDQVGLPQAFHDRFPVELSGGQRQRVAIARALAPEPRLLLCDEPVSALDVSIQAQILELLAELQRRHGLAYLFVSHDLAVVRQVSDRVAVMREGKLVEIGPADAVFRAPQHPYTQLLLDSIPGRRLAAAS